MFTGLVEEVGVVRRLERLGGGARLVIAAKRVLEGMRVGDSVSISGACLTAVDIKREEFAVECMEETLSRTTLGSVDKGDEVNLERALTWGERIGGHLVMGHVDAVAMVSNVVTKGIALEVELSLPEPVRPFVAAKGSVAVDGVSLTVIDQNGDSFKVGLIPHTVANTTLRQLKSGVKVNLEADIIARYVHRAVHDSGLAEGLSSTQAASLTEEMLRDKGFA
jgi:riboflavin synthase